MTAHAEVEAVWRRFLDGVERGDVALIAGCLADEVTMYLPFITQRDTLRGPQEVLAAFARMYQATAGAAVQPRALRISIERFDWRPLGEDVCLVESLLRFGSEFGRRSVVFRRQADGWRLLHLHGSNVAQPASRLPLALG